MTREGILCGKCRRPRGRDHPLFKGKDPENTEHNRRRHQWYKQIKEKYNFICQITGIRGRSKLASHHLYNAADYPDKEFDLDNGICIQRNFHIQFHHEYGYGKNTPEQFEKFVRKLCL